MRPLFIPSFIIGILALTLIILPVRAVDQVRTTDILITSSDNAVDSSITRNFTLYVGDTISNVQDPVKSFYISISGVYDGSGILALTLDNDDATQQIYTLPNTSDPVAFEIVYKDPTNSINPTSAGSYEHSLTIAPTGVTIYGLSARATETHEYVPASCPDGAQANQKVKTNEFLVTSSGDAVDSVITDSFTLYIGDTLTGVVDPLKSGYFLSRGVYTGSGSVTMTLDNDASTAKTFTLPNASNPTPFELLYNDATPLIDPSSGGSYTHSLTIDPSGPTLYGLGTTFLDTHQYKPPSCDDMPIKGELYSAVFDTTGVPEGPAYNAILWKGSLGGPGFNTGHVRFQLAASECANGATNYPTCSTGTWAFVGGATCAAGDWFDPGAPDTALDLSATSCVSSWNNKRYFRYAVQICSHDCATAGSFTPSVEDVVVNWSP